MEHQLLGLGAEVQVLKGGSWDCGHGRDAHGAGLGSLGCIEKSQGGECRCANSFLST